jgi:hypothetical protein
LRRFHSKYTVRSVTQGLPDLPITLSYNRPIRL